MPSLHKAGVLSSANMSLWAIVVLLVLATLRIVYNLFFHPLSSFPGPKLAAATSLWRAFIDIFGKEMFTTRLRRLHEQYGDIVRVAPNELHFADPAAYHDIYNAKNRWHKDASLYDSLRTEGRASFHLPGYRDAKRRRDAMMSLLSRSSIASMQHLMQENLELLCDGLAARYNRNPEQATNLLFAMQALTLETITSFCFGRSMNAMLAEGFDDPLTRAMRGALPCQPWFRHVPVSLWLLNNIPPALMCLVQPSLGAFYKFKKTVVKQVEEVMQYPESLTSNAYPTIFHALMNGASTDCDEDTDEKAKIVGERPLAALTPQQLASEAYLLVFAGTDTASNAMFLGVSHVLDDGAIHARLRRELREAWPDLETRPTWEEVEKLPYLRAVVKEALRVSHGVITPAARVVPPEGAVICGRHIPGGTIVGMGNAFVHLSERVFKDPYTFKPERWLEPGAEALDQWLVAFHRGPRSCIGVNLAYCELFLTFANLFRRFDMSLCGARPKDMSWKEYYLPHYAGPPIEVIAQPVAAPSEPGTC